LRFLGHLPIAFWGECILVAGNLINCTPSALLNGKTPYEVLYGALPKYDHLRVIGYLRVIGSLCYAHTKGGINLHVKVGVFLSVTCMGRKDGNYMI